MKNISKIKIVLVLFGILFASITLGCFQIISEQGIYEGIPGDRNDMELINPKTSSYWTLDFIHIDNNWTATASHDWCNGDGSWSNPFIIENITIDATDSPTGVGIFINNSKNDYFVIRNCTVYNAGTGSFGAGIRLENTDNGILMNNTCSNNGRHGIILYDSCQNITISGNTVFENTYGIYLEEKCNNNVISGNTANHNPYYGIRLLNECNDNIISGNIASNTETSTQHVGILFSDYCEGNTISGNIVNDNLQYGIYFQRECDNNIISGNTASDNSEYGIYIYNYCDENIISGNTANGNGQHGIQLYNHCDHNTLSGNTANGNGNGYAAINIWNGCGNNTISENTANSNTHGIYISVQCDDNTISGNIIYSNLNGIYLHTCQNNLIYRNYCFNHSGYNAYNDNGANDWDDGVIGNFWGDYSGMDANNDGIGDTPYDIPGSSGMKDDKPIMIYNPFFANPPCDMTYEIGTEGHYIKWTVIDTVASTLPFNVFQDGTSMKTGMLSPNVINEITINVDHLDVSTHGLTLEIYDEYGRRFTDGVWVSVTNTAPLISVKPDDISYIIGETGSSLLWIFVDGNTNNPTYTITRNGVPIIVDEQCCSSEVIDVSVDGLEVGFYEYVIEIDDGYGETVLSGASVRVYSTINPNPNIVDILIPTVIAVGSVAVISTAGFAISLTKKKRLRLK